MIFDLFLLVKKLLVLSAFLFACSDNPEIIAYQEDEDEASKISYMVTGYTMFNTSSTFDTIDLSQLVGKTITITEEDISFGQRDQIGFYDLMNLDWCKFIKPPDTIVRSNVYEFIFNHGLESSLFKGRYGKRRIKGPVQIITFSSDCDYPSLQFVLIDDLGFFSMGEAAFYIAKEPNPNQF